MQHSAGSDFVAPEISITISYPLLRADSATRDKGRVLAYFLSPLIHPSLPQLFTECCYVPGTGTVLGIGAVTVNKMHKDSPVCP